MKIVIVGTGYVGLVTAACFAHLGVEVCCVDRDADKVRRLREGENPIYEPGLDGILSQQRRAGRITFASQMPALDDQVDAVMIAVGTPPMPDGAGADLSAVFAVADDIAAALRGRSVIVAVKSTVPVGIGDEIEAHIRARRPDVHVAVVSNPEFLRQGQAVADFLNPDRVVIGAEDSNAAQVMALLYANMVRTGAQMLFTGRRASELVKSASNAFLASKIAFINDIADLCEATGADVREVAQGIGLDRRIGSAFLEAGPGFGGSCFPKDCADILATAGRHGVRLRVIEGALAGNDIRKMSMAHRIAHALGGEVGGKTIAVLGLTFKADTDDMRDAPSIPMIQALIAAGAHVRAYDPQGMGAARRIMPSVTYCEDGYAAARNADAVVLGTAWKEFSKLDADRLARAVRQKLFIDLRNGVDVFSLKRVGFTVLGIGRSWESSSVMSGPSGADRRRFAAYDGGDQAIAETGT